VVLKKLIQFNSIHTGWDGHAILGGFFYVFGLLLEDAQ